MNKSMLTGLVAGIAVATAGGVAGYAYLGQGTDSQAQIEAQDTQEALAEPGAPAAATPASKRPRGFGGNGVIRSGMS